MEISISNLIYKKISFVDGNEKLQKVVSIFRQNPEIDSVVVIENGKYLGLITERHLLRLKIDPNIKVKNVAKKIPTIHFDTDLTTTIRLMIENNVRSIPVMDLGEVKGVIRMIDILNSFRDSEFGERKVKDYMIEDVITIKPSAKISKAIVLMRKHNISRLPVVENGKLVGIVTIRDIIEKVILPKEKIGFGEYVDSKIPTLSLPVKSIMTKDPITVFEEDTISKAISIMYDRNVSGLPILNNVGSLTGIITLKDLMVGLLSYLEKGEEEFFLSISTVGFSLDEEDKKWIKEYLLSRIVRKYKNILGREIHIFLHLKKEREEIESARMTRFFNARLRIYSENVRIFASDSGIGIYDTVRLVVRDSEEQLERIKREKERRVPIEYEYLEML